MAGRVGLDVQIPTATQGQVLELLGPALQWSFLSSSHLIDEKTEGCRSTDFPCSTQHTESEAECLVPRTQASSIGLPVKFEFGISNK